MGEELDLTWNQIWFSQLELELKSNLFFGRTWPETEFPISFMSKIVIAYPLVRFNNQVVDSTDFKAQELAEPQVKLF